MGWRSSSSASRTASTTLRASWSSRRRGDDRFNATANVEVSHDFDKGRPNLRFQIVEDPVDGALVEDAVVPVAPEIELEALELHAQVRRAVRDQDRAKVRGTALQQVQ